MNTVDTNPPQDRVSRVLIIIMLIVTVLSWAAMIAMTVHTYHGAPPLPGRIVSQNGNVVMTRTDLEAGKAAFQRTDLMDYGSLYGMGAYFGEDYTSSALVALAEGTREAMAQDRYGSGYDRLDKPQQLAVDQAMRSALQGIDLTADPVVVDDSVARAIDHYRESFATRIRETDPKEGYT